VDENLTDQQRAEQVRIWLRENVWYLIAGLVIGLGALFGWREWTSYSSSHAETASGLYEELLGAIRVNRATRAEEIATQLDKEFGSSPYVDQARFAMAKMRMEKSQPEEAAKYLGQVVEHPSSPEMASIARLRLGRVLIQQEKYDDALDTLEMPDDSAFASHFHEARGDAYYALGKLAEARKEYEAALAASPEVAGEQPFLRAKLDEVAGRLPGVDAAAAAGNTAPAPGAAPPAE